MCARTNIIKDKVRQAIHAVKAYDRSVLEGMNWDHVLHCIEAVRQGLMCRFDDTLLSVAETWPPLGDGSAQPRMCTNTTALKAWANDHAGVERKQWNVTVAL